MEIPKKTLFEKSVGKNKFNVSLTLYSQIFCEIVSYFHKKSSTVENLEDLLHKCGVDIGSRLVDILNYKERGSKREIRLLNYLLFLKTSVWKTILLKKILFTIDICHLNKKKCNVTAHWHKGTTFMIVFEDSVISRDNDFDSKK
ncbi:hypothetical protein HZS_2080 [Henneguya salminicola]|nr:hypothetical protein HZS_2080 [Henneguya salminicola]